MKDEIVQGELPSRDPLPDMTRLLLENFPEAQVLRYQQHLAEAGLREVVHNVRHAFGAVASRREGLPEEMRTLVDGLLNLMNPDHPESEGPYPSKLVRP